MDVFRGKNIAFKIGSKWFLGKALKSSFKKIKQVKKLSDVENIKEFITLNQFLKINNISLEEKDNILKKYKVDNIYILNETEELMPENDIKAFEKWWWSVINKDCIKCSKICKQSSKVDIISCQRTK